MLIKSPDVSEKRRQELYSLETTLDASTVRKIHAEILAGEPGLDGERQDSPLEGAISRAEWHTLYGNRGDHFDVAALYSVSLVCSHAFIDGNKRTGLVAGLRYLEYQDIDIQRHAALDDVMVGIADGYFIREEVAATFRACAPECRGASNYEEGSDDDAAFAALAVEKPEEAKILREGWNCLSPIGKNRLIELAEQLLHASNRERERKGEPIKQPAFLTDAKNR